MTRGLDSQLLEFWVSSLECLVDGEGNTKLEEKKDIFDIIQRLKSSETALLTFRQNRKEHIYVAVRRGYQLFTNLPFVFSYETKSRRFLK